MTYPGRHQSAVRRSDTHTPFQRRQRCQRRFRVRSVQLWAAAAVAGLLGLGITAYCVVKCFDFPDLGPTGAVSLPLPGGAVDATASTVLGAGPFVGIVGGLLLVASAVGHTSDAAATAPGGPSSTQQEPPCPA